MPQITDVDGGRWIPVNADALTELAKRYTALHEQQKHRQWISVEERLPESMGNVLVVAFWHEHWQTMIGWHSDAGKLWRVFTSHGEREPGAVTHWMPLPESPEGE